jgi:hypothetical protein
MHVYVITVAALYVDPRGPYPTLGVDCWDEARDARTYDGPYPVVAHPPCGPWGRLRHLYRGAEHDCAPRAVEQVREFGGALEHPAGSKLWGACGLPHPSRSYVGCQGGSISGYLVGGESVGECGELPTDECGGYTIEVNQCEWGHVARKRTWLYLVGVPRDALEAPPFPGREPTHWISGGRGREGKKAKTTPAPPGIKVCSAQQRRRTPPLFAEYLVRLARAARRVP